MLNFNAMYNEYESKYNPYPVQMSRSQAFTRALQEGLIDNEIFEQAKKYFGDLWYYVGD